MKYGSVKEPMFILTAKSTSKVIDFGVVKIST